MKNILLFLMCFGILGFASAQTKEKKTPTEKACKYADELKQSLNLSKEQRDKVYTIRLVRLNSEASIKAKYPDKKDEERKTKMKALKQEFQNALAKILTSAQYKQYKEIKAAEKEKKKKKEDDEDVSQE